MTEVSQNTGATPRRHRDVSRANFLIRLIDAHGPWLYSWGGGLQTSCDPEGLRAIIAFSDGVRNIDPLDIAEGGWDYVYGSNLAEALDLATARRFC